MRPELIHPMLVHFPIALLFTGVIIRLVAALVKKRDLFSFLLPASWLVLLLGVIAAWVAIIAGEIARDIVAPTIENMNILNEHEEHAYFTAFSFTIALFTDGIRTFLLNKKHKGLNLLTISKTGWFVKRGLAITMWFLYLFGLGNLVVTGMYGAALVYEEGAAVEKTNH